jgi:cytoskeletal protein RodZ
MALYTASGSGAGSDTGLGLRDIRERAGVSIEDIETQTCISRRFLRAIERGDYGELPGGIFSTSYIRQYAGAIGYDPTQLLRHFYQATGQCPEAVAAEPRQRGTTHSLLRFLGLF